MKNLRPPGDMVASRSEQYIDEGGGEEDPSSVDGMAYMGGLRADAGTSQAGRLASAVQMPPARPGEDDLEGGEEDEGLPRPRRRRARRTGPNPKPRRMDPPLESTDEPAWVN